MSRVYFYPLPDKAPVEVISSAARKVLEHLSNEEQVVWEKKVPLKCHFGERGNRTFLKAETFDGIIDFLQEKGIDCSFIETSVLYGGERFERARHIALAQKHGFVRLPVVIADGARGEDAVNVPVDLKHFKHCAVAADLANAPQVLVLSHFKGHALAGFGGAIKQLSMGFAAKGGKMAMHMGVKPRIRKWFCRSCQACVRRCNEQAIVPDGKKFRIDHNLCVGCGACFSICPHHAVSVWSWNGIANAVFRGKYFREKLVEYACAGHNGKRNIYLNFAINITRGCDCEPRPMGAVCSDIGIFASTDPLAVDAACINAVRERRVRFKGTEQLEYAEECKLGSLDYELIDLSTQE